MSFWKTLFFAAGLTLVVTCCSSAQQDTAATAHAQLRQRALAASKAEADRETHGDCSEAKNTVNLDSCLTREMKITDGNYTALVRAIGGVLRSQPPGPPGGGDFVHEFDGAEQTWLSYRKEQCSSLYDEYIGGTIRGFMYGTCMQTLTRSHMRDLMKLHQEDLS